MRVGQQTCLEFIELEIDSTYSWLVLAISIALYCLASVVATSLRSVTRDHLYRLVEQEVRGSVVLADLRSSSSGLDGSIILLKYLFLSSVIVSGVVMAIEVVGTHWGLIPLEILGALLFIGLTQMVSKIVCHRWGESVALRVAPAVRLLAFAFGPVLSLGGMAIRRESRAADYRFTGHEKMDDGIGLSIESDGAPLDEPEARMVRGVVLLDKTTAREIMVPRVDMVVAEMGTLLSELVDQMVEWGHSRVPVYRDRLDQIIGIAYSRDVLGLISRNKDASVRITDAVIRPALFIPESKNLEALLNEFQTMQVHMAIVIDEYGGVSGLVTFEDLLEEIVGEIHDEFDVGEMAIESVGDDEYLMDARVSLDDINELLSVSVVRDGFDTVGGFVYQRLGKIPSLGDTVEHDGVKIEVISTIGRRLNKLRVSKLSK